MKKTYFDLIDQTYYFPQESFDLNEGDLYFNNVSIKHLIDKYGTPLKISYLPKIGDQIKRAKNWFNKSIKHYNYDGTYNYAYCTKSSHFSFIVEEALKNKVSLETSSAYDIDILIKLFEKEKIDKSIKLIHNGYKTKDYLNKLAILNEMGFTNSIIVLDCKSELDRLSARFKKPFKIGVRMAIDEEPQSPYYTSRMGIRSAEILSFFNDKIKNNTKVSFEMLHFFVDSGIKDTVYYWGLFSKALDLYAILKKDSPNLKAINIGGGLPIRNNLGFEYDYKHIINEIVRNTKETCDNASVEHPDVYTEFGKFTVGESGAVIFSVIESKQQNDNELWYVIDNSLMTTIPDSWGLLEKFILLPINKWDKPYTRVNIGGISCDHSDYYNSEDFNQQVFLPKTEENDKEPLYIGFFHTGAYQDSISGYGGIKHCLIPSPKHIIIRRNKNGQLEDSLFKDEQTVDGMLDILGY